MSDSKEGWVKLRTKSYQAAYRRGKVGEVVKCWWGDATVKDGQIVFRKPSGEITVGSEAILRDYEEDKTE